MTSFNLATAVFSLRRDCPKMAKKHGDECLTYLIFAVRACAGFSRGSADFAGGSRFSA